VAEYWAPYLHRALTGAPSGPLKLARDYLADAPPTDDPDLRDLTRRWLQARHIPIAAKLTGPMHGLWTDGFLVGAISARTMLSHHGIVVKADDPAVQTISMGADWKHWTPGDWEAARELIDMEGMGTGLKALLEHGGIVLKGIEDYKLDQLAQILAAGVGRGDSPQTIATAIRALVDDPKWAYKVALTETTRAVSSATLLRYGRNGVSAKEWMTAGDQHVCTNLCEPNGEEGAVPLDEPFQSSDYAPPAHPLCRCSIGPAWMTAEEVASYGGTGLPLLPESTVEGVRSTLREVESTLEAEGAAAEAAPSTAGGTGAVAVGPEVVIRPELEAARTSSQVGKAFEAEAQRITGRTGSDAIMGHFEGSAVTAREHAEGLLRGLERFPDAKLRSVSAGGPTGNTYAHAAGDRIAFNYRWTKPAARKEYLDSLAAGERTHWHPYGTNHPVGIAIHEFGHIIDVETLGGAVSAEIESLVADAAVLAGVTDEQLIAFEISQYATTNTLELAAEAFADVMMNGQAASQLSQDIYEALLKEYKAGGRAFTSTARVVARSTAAPADLSKLTVAQLKALAKERGITVPAKVLKKDLLELLQTAVVDDGLDALETHSLRSLATEFELKGVTSKTTRETLLKKLRAAGVKSPKVAQAEEAAKPALTLAQRVKAGITSVEQISKGTKGTLVERLQLSDGSTVIRRTAKPFDGFTAKEAADAEEIGSAMLRAFGLQAPETYRASVRVVYEDLVPTRTAAQLVKAKGFTSWSETQDLIAQYAATDEGRVLGLVDALMGITRGLEDWGISADGQLVALNQDLGFRWGIHGISTDPAKAPFFTDPFSGFMSKPGSPGDWVKMDLSQADAHTAVKLLADLRPQFERLGHLDWFSSATERLAHIADNAVGAALRVGTPEQRAAIKAATRAAARERNKLIERSTGSAHLLAEIDELVAKNATEAAIRERLSEALIAPEQLFANANPELLPALRQALATGDMTKLRSTVVRLSTKQGLKGIGKAGQELKFNPETMEPVSGVPIKPGAVVKIARRGTTLTLPDGSTMQLTRAQVTKVIQPSSIKTVREGEFQGLRRIGEQPSGTNPGGIYEAADGSRWYVKAVSDAEHGANEKLAADLYRAAGIDVPEIAIGTGAPGLTGDTMLASRLVENGQDLSSLIRSGDAETLKKLRAGFAVDAWLANWDLAGIDYANLMLSGGKVYRIDVGGSLIFRGGVGLPKGDLFGDVVHEWDTLRDPSKSSHAARIFGGMTDKELKASVARVAKVTPEKIRELVTQFGMPDSIADTLIARRMDLLNKFDFFEKRAQGAVKESRVLERTGYHLDDPATHAKALSSLSENERDQVHAALREYRGSNYQGINAYLRTGGTDSRLYGISVSTAERYAGDIDKAMAASELQDDVLVWRGVRTGTSVFGDHPWPASLAGFSWTDPAFFSTSASQSTASQFSDAVMMRFLVPKGTKALVLSGDNYESELLLNRGLKYRVVRDHGEVEIQGRDVRMLDVEVTSTGGRAKRAAKRI
jgi:hypothetical protein